MAEVVEEEPKKSPLIKILMFVIGGILLLVIGLGIGYLLFGGEPETDPSSEAVSYTHLTLPTNREV